MSVIFIGAVSAAHQQGTVGDFTQSPTEHIIDRIDQPFVVRSVKGVIGRRTDGPPLALQGVLFEIQGPGAERKIVRATTDKNGRFRIGHVPAGIYKFKATLNGFQSVMGTITVSKDASKLDEIEIAMPIGV
ncbi:MAG: prealbumin-like fold domain-containing protein [Candidatus Acidiferrales bacterium]